MKRLAFLAVVACLCGCALPGTGRAGYIVTFLQQGHDVVATGKGTIDTTDLTFDLSTSRGGQINPGIGAILVGPANPGTFDIFAGVSGPNSFGTGGGLFASAGSGDFVGVSGPIDFTTDELAVSSLSGPLADTMTFDNQTFKSMGVTPGTYVWTWGTGAHADSFTLDIVAPTTSTPEPASLTLLGLGAAGLAGYGWRRKRAAA